MISLFLCLFIVDSSVWTSEIIHHRFYKVVPSITVLIQYWGSLRITIALTDILQNLDKSIRCNCRCYCFSLEICIRRILNGGALNIRCLLYERNHIRNDSLWFLVVFRSSHFLLLGTEFYWGTNQILALKSKSLSSRPPWSCYSEWNAISGFINKYFSYVWIQSHF